MSLSFRPEYYCATFDCLSAAFLSSIGVKGVVLDIDNTLEPYENPLPGDRVTRWLDSLAQFGIKTAIVSNNNKERVELFNSELKMPAYYKAAKPFKKNVLRALADMSVSKDEAILIGDQVFTDVWAAHNSGLRAALVPPIKDKTDPFTKFKRLLERPFLKNVKMQTSVLYPEKSGGDFN